MIAHRTQVSQPMVATANGLTETGQLANCVSGFALANQRMY